MNSGAVIGLDGQENKVDLTYSNNPNYTGDGASTPNEDKGKTPEDKVIVFTYELYVTKYLGDEHTKANAATSSTQSVILKFSSTVAHLVPFAFRA